MPPKMKGKGNGSLKKPKHEEFPEIHHLPYSLESNSLMMMMMRVFRMWSLAIHRAYREESDLSLCWAQMQYCRNCCAPAHMSYGVKLAAKLDSCLYRSSKIC